MSFDLRTYHKVHIQSIIIVIIIIRCITVRIATKLIQRILIKYALGIIYKIISYSQSKLTKKLIKKIAHLTITLYVWEWHLHRHQQILCDMNIPSVPSLLDNGHLKVRPTIEKNKGNVTPTCRNLHESLKNSRNEIIQISSKYFSVITCYGNANINQVSHILGIRSSETQQGNLDICDTWAIVLKIRKKRKNYHYLRKTLSNGIYMRRSAVFRVFFIPWSLLLNPTFLTLISRIFAHWLISNVDLYMYFQLRWHVYMTDNLSNCHSILIYTWKWLPQFLVEGKDSI